MMLRMRLLKGANALLYIGPLVAGMSGFGWGLIASFTAIFVVWLIVLRPEQLPKNGAEWRLPSAWLSVLTIILSQVVLVAVLFAIGRGIGAVTGFLPVVNPQLPLAISFVAIPLCRLLWNAEEAANRGIFLDEEAEAANAPRMAAAAADAIVPLVNLPDETPDGQVAAEVARVLDSATAELRLSALTAALSRSGRSHSALRRALLLWAALPEIVSPRAVPGSMALALGFANGNTDLLRLYVPRAIALIAAFPDRAADFPTPALLRETAAQVGAAPLADLPDDLMADLRDGLGALAMSVEQALASVAESAAGPQSAAGASRQAQLA